MEEPLRKYEVFVYDNPDVRLLTFEFNFICFEYNAPLISWVPLHMKMISVLRGFKNHTSDFSQNISASHEPKL